MASVMPTNHPITGRPLPRRITFRRFSDQGVGPVDSNVWNIFNADNEPFADPLRLGRAIRTPSDGSTAGMQTAFNVPVRSGGKVDVGAVGIHVSGIRTGTTGSDYPSVLGDVKFSLVLNPVGASGYGIALSQDPGDEYAWLYNSRSGEFISLDGSDPYGQAFSYLTQRSTNLGFMYDFYTDEAIIYTLNASGEFHPVVIRRIPGGILPDPLVVERPYVTPRVTVQNTSGNGYGRIQFTRLDLDVWTD